MKILLGIEHTSSLSLDLNFVYIYLRLGLTQFRLIDVPNENINKFFRMVSLFISAFSESF